MTRLVLFALPATLLSLHPGFQIRHVWYLSVGSIIFQACLNLLLLRRLGRLHGPYRLFLSQFPGTHEEFIKLSPRLQAVALLPVQDPKAAAKELRRAVSELGHVGAMLAADGTHLLGDERFLPIYEEAERLGVMLGIHASGSHLGGAGVDLFPTFIQAHTCSHAFGQMRQLTSIVFEGIPERFPRLRIAYLEAGCGWAPYWMERMDDEYAKRAEEAPALRKKPSEYIRSGSIYFSCEADEWLLPQALKLVGENQIVYASDFPHWDHSFPQSIDEIRDRGDLSDAQKRKILGDNARRLYGLK